MTAPRRCAVEDCREVTIGEGFRFCSIHYDAATSVLERRFFGTARYRPGRAVIPRFGGLVPAVVDFENHPTGEVILVCETDLEAVRTARWLEETRPASRPPVVVVRERRPKIS